MNIRGWLWSSIGLKLFDVVSTAILLREYGTGMELNPFVSWTIETFGMAAALSGNMALVVIICCILYRLNQKRNLIVVAAMMLLVAINNGFGLLLMFI